MIVPLLLVDSRVHNRGDAFPYPHFTAEKTRHRDEITGDTCFLGLAAVEAELEFFLVVCMYWGFPSPTWDLTSLLAVPECGLSTSESLS